MDDGPTRRQVLRGIATGAGVISTAGVAAASLGARVDAIRDTTTITYEQEWLDRYRPFFDVGREDRSRLLTVRAWKVTDTEFDTDVGVYWAEYTHQTGVTSYDSHNGDHEPVYVFVDDTGGVDTVIASIYHWLRGEVPGDTVTGDGTHPRLRVISPWHHYGAAAPTDATYRPEITPLGTGPALRDPDQTTELEGWLANGHDESLATGVTVNPWLMFSRESWWKGGFFGLSLTEQLVQFQQFLGRGVAGDLTEATA